MPWRRNAGPKTRSSAATTSHRDERRRMTAHDVALDAHAVRRRHASIDRLLDELVRRGAATDRAPGRDAREWPTSTALRIASSSVGSRSSRYRATCESVTRRRSGSTRPQRDERRRTRPARTTRKPTIDAALNRSAWRVDADRNSASSVPATTKTAPRSARRMRQRLRTRRMTSTSSRRRLEPPSPSDM